MKVEISLENIKKLERLVDFTIEDASDLQQAISLVIEMHKNDIEKLRVGDVVTNPNFGKATVLEVTENNRCHLITERGNVSTDWSMQDLKFTGQVNHAVKCALKMPEIHVMSKAEHDRGHWAKTRLLQAILAAQGFQVVELDEVGEEYKTLKDLLNKEGN